MRKISKKCLQKSHRQTIMLKNVNERGIGQERRGTYKGSRYSHKEAIAKLKLGIDRLDGLSAKLDKIREKMGPEKTTEKGEKGSLKEKLAHMQEKAGRRTRSRIWKNQIKRKRRSYNPKVLKNYKNSCCKNPYRIIEYS